jgi:ankyrin repeat protein
MDQDQKITMSYERIKAELLDCRFDSVLQLIIECSDDLDLSFEDNYLIKYACQYEREDIVEELVVDFSDRIDPSVDHNCVVRFAIKNGLIDMIYGLFWDERVQFRENGVEFVAFACSVGQLEIVRLLLQRAGIEFSSCYLAQACENGHLEIVRLLLQDERWDASYGYSGNDAFKSACENGWHEIVQLLIDDGKVKISNDGIELACKYSQEKVVEILLPREEVDVGKCIKIAVESGSLMLVELLLKDVRAKVTIECVELACKYRTSAFVKVLCEHGEVDRKAVLELVMTYLGKDPERDELIEYLSGR